MMDEYRLPSGKLFHKLWEITMLFIWVNQLFLWSFSIAMFVYQRVIMTNHLKSSCLVTFRESNMACRKITHFLDEIPVKNLIALRGFPPCHG